MGREPKNNIVYRIYIYIYRVCVSPYQVLKMNGINGPTPSFFFGNYRDCKKVVSTPFLNHLALAVVSFIRGQ